MEGNLAITLDEKEIENHENALIIFIKIINAQVKWIMIDIGISTNIIYFDVFQKLGSSTNDLT